MNFKWLVSSTARQAKDMHKHVRRMLAAQRDLLAQQSIIAVEAALKELKEAIENNGTDDQLKNRMTDLEAAANKWLRSYPNPGIRENVEVLLVALAVAMSIRTFFVQPFKIPTGSMQPTLFGVTSLSHKGEPDFKIPGALGRIYEAFVHGRFFHHAVAEQDGEITAIGEPEHVAKFINKQSIQVSYQTRPITFWFTPEDHFEDRAGIQVGEKFHKGDDILKFEEIAGDHLFVDRVSYNFRHPKRGEIIVFETKGIGNQYGRLPPDQFYIKRMVAMGDEHVQLGADRHLVINGVRLDSKTPHFENVYSFNPTMLPMESHYSGHVDGPELAPLFFENPDGVVVRPNHYMVMGDNTVNSYDSRRWGDFTRTNVIGKYFFVYWPFSQRFGWSAR